MCGIAGIASFGGAPPPDEPTIRRMCGQMRYRGPDDEGVEIRGLVGLGMRRLSIIDVKGGHQPIHNEDDSIRVVFNGEIYNFQALRLDLEKRGHVFSTHTDTEVIVHAYEEYGDDFATRLNGMFAIALHDERSNRLVLVRDHVGIKPLYYAYDGRTLVWGSEIKVVLASGRVDRRLDLLAFSEFLRWEYVPEDRTLIQSVRKLRSGHLIAIDLRDPKLQPVQYWDVSEPGTQGPSFSELEWIERIDAQIQQSVTRQMVSDVPLGAFLSGGVDSSLVVAAMGAAAETFSIGFDDPTYDELPWARRVAEHLGVRHHVEIIKSDVHLLFDDLMMHMDDPIGDFSIFPTYLVAQMARKHVTVCLSGDGGDELFGGYETYLADAWSTRIPSIFRFMGKLESIIRPSPAKKGLINKAKRFLEGLQHDPALQHARWRLFMSEIMSSELLSDSASAGVGGDANQHIEKAFLHSSSRDRLSANLYADFKTYLPDNILTKVDRMTMAVSLEARVPLLDKDLVEMAFALPSGYKIKNGELKSFLKKVAARHIPKACVYRPKQGFSIPIKNWLKTSLKPLMCDLLSASRVERQGLLDVSTTQRLIAQHLNGTHNHSHILWSLMVFQRWHELWVEERI
jgi:asparagine synthase (glutamine-hydrolysing)